MKKQFMHFLFLFFLCFFAIAQSTSQELKVIKKEISKDNLSGENYTQNKNNTSTLYYENVFSYESNFNTKKNTTTINYSKNGSYTVPGKWMLVNAKQYSTDYYISHCPMFFNEDGVTMEYSMWDGISTNKEFKNSYTKLEYIKKKFETKNNKNKVKHELIKYDSIQNFYLYKMKKWNAKSNEFFDLYYLIGVKALKSFRIAVFNFKEEDYENMEDFIIQCYTMNR